MSGRGQIEWRLCKLSMYRIFSAGQLMAQNDPKRALEDLDFSSSRGSAPTAATDWWNVQLTVRIRKHEEMTTFPPKTM